VYFMDHFILLRYFNILHCDFVFVCGRLYSKCRLTTFFVRFAHDVSIVCAIITAPLKC